MKIVAIIQARMGSSRLPAKVLVDIEGKTMLQRIVERVRAACQVDEIVIATTIAPEDDALVEYAERELKSLIFRGSVQDVLDRFFHCAKLYRANIIVRITADDPLKDPQLIDQAVALLKANPTLAYCSNTIEPSFPEGLDIEAFRFWALEKAHEEAKLPSEREHVTPFIWKNPAKFETFNFKADKNLSDWRWTVDKPEDLEFMRCIFKEFKDQPLVDYKTVVVWLNEHPKIKLINKGTARNEGYYKSLEMEN